MDNFADKAASGSPSGGIGGIPNSVGTGADATLSKEERNWAMIAHLSPLIGYLIPIPFVNIIAPLVIGKMKGETMPFVREQANEVVNFQITVFLIALVVIALCFVVIGLFIAPVFGLIVLILMIMGAMKAGDGIHYRYPFSLRLVK